MHDLTAFQRDILYVTAAQDPPYGLAIKSTLEDYYEREINHGRLYPNLDTLVDRDLLEKGELDKRTNSYDLTDRAYQLLAARRQWEDEYVDVEAGTEVSTATP